MFFLDADDSGDGVFFLFRFGDEVGVFDATGYTTINSAVS